VVGYVLRRNFRRFWYVLLTGDEHPDWEKLGGDYFVASWEKRSMKSSASKEKANMPESVNLFEVFDGTAARWGGFSLAVDYPLISAATSLR
jgi:hypothetical protein